jgi:hypothetical protein
LQRDSRKFARRAQVSRKLKTLGIGDSSRKGAKYAKFGIDVISTEGRNLFLDPSHPLGMTGLGLSPLLLGALRYLLRRCLAGDIPKPTGARSAPYKNLRVRSPWRA